MNEKSGESEADKFHVRVLHPHWIQMRPLRNTGEFTGMLSLLIPGPGVTVFLNCGLGIHRILCMLTNLSSACAKLHLDNFDYVYMARFLKNLKLQGCY